MENVANYVEIFEHWSSAIINACLILGVVVAAVCKWQKLYLEIVDLVFATVSMVSFVMGVVFLYTLLTDPFNMQAVSLTLGCFVIMGIMIWLLRIPRGQNSNSN